MGKDLCEFVNKEFQKLLSNIDIKQVHSVLEEKPQSNILRILSKSKSPEVKRIFHNICHIIVDAIDQFIDKHGAIVKEEVNYSVSEYLNTQIGQETYQNFDIRNEIVESQHFRKIFREKGIKKVKISTIATMKRYSKRTYLENRAIFYKTEEGATEYLQEKSKQFGYKIKEYERTRKMNVHSDIIDERLKGIDYLSVIIDKSAREIKNQECRKSIDDTCTYAQIAKIFQNSKIDEDETKNILQSPLRKLLIIKEAPDEPFSVSRTVAFANAYVKDKKFRGMVRQYFEMIQS